MKRRQVMAQSQCRLLPHPSIKPLGARLLSLPRYNATCGMALPRNKPTTVMATTPDSLRNVGRSWHRVNLVFYHIQVLSHLGHGYYHFQVNLVYYHIQVLSHLGHGYYHFQDIMALGTWLY